MINNIHVDSSFIIFLFYYTYQGIQKVFKVSKLSKWIKTKTKSTVQRNNIMTTSVQKELTQDSIKKNIMHN